MPYELKIGTRGSQLALFQANWVKDQLVQTRPDLKVSLIKIKTTGDKIQHAPLAKICGKGLFVKEIEEALIQRKIDLAVHSIKDVPTEFPRGLHLSVITGREDPRDVFISREGRTLRELPQGARIGTSSLRRQAQLLHFRSDFELIPLRGGARPENSRSPGESRHVRDALSRGRRQMGRERLRVQFSVTRSNS